MIYIVTDSLNGIHSGIQNDINTYESIELSMILNA